jgi:parallel beta-helix repeat protein
MHGVSISSESKANQIGQIGAANVVAFNGGDGVRVEGAGTNANTITGNSIHDNDGKGIELLDGANLGVLPPEITGFGSVLGTACPSCTVDVYSDDGDEGRVYEGTVLADGAGAWSFPGTPAGPNVTATATSFGNTSEFSVPEEVPGPATPTPSPSPTETPGPVLIQGDVDCSGEVDALDALALVLDESGLEYEKEPGCPAIGSGDPQFGDVNCSEGANAADAALPLMFKAGVTIATNDNCVPVGDPL